MPPELLPILAAATLGFLHALEIDHMIAVTAFVSTRPRIGAAARFGLRWGLGHSVAVLLAGGILLATGLRWPERYDSLGEGIVGVMLVGIGIWAVRRARALHLHSPDEQGSHAHLHAHGADAPHDHHHGEAGGHHHHPVEAAGHHHHHDPAPSHPHTHAPPASTSGHTHGHGITLVGLLHGLAGTTGVVALVPVTLIERTWVGLVYLLAFGAGTIVAMLLFAVVAAFAMHQAAERSLIWGRRIATLVGVGGVLVGVYWILTAVRGVQP